MHARRVDEEENDDEEKEDEEENEPADFSVRQRNMKSGEMWISC